MAAKVGYEAIKYVLKKVLTKKGVKGIATIPGKAYDMRMGQLTDEMVKKMRGMGYDINKVTQKEVQGLLDSAEAMEKQRLQKIQSRFFDKSGQMKQEGKDIVKEGLAGLEKKDPFKGFDPKVVKTPKKDRPSIRLIKNFERDLTDMELAQEGYNLQEIDILKRARNVMKKEGQNPDDALSWVRSEMADDAGIEFEDFMTDFDWGDFPGKAEGGRIGYAAGTLVKGGKWFLKSLHDTRAKIKTMTLAPDQMKYFLNQIDDQIKSIKAGNPIPEEVLQKIRSDSKFKSLTQTRANDPDLFEMEEALLEYGQKHASGGLAYMLGEPNTRIEALQHAGVIADPRGLYTDPSIYTKGETDEAVPQNYFEGGGVGRGPWTKGQAAGTTEQPPQSETPVHHAQGLSDPMKAPRGLPSVAPRTMDPQYIQQQRMQQAMMGRGNMAQGPRPMAAEGGIMRMGLKKGGDMSRRGFMKLIAGLAALPVFGKYFKAAKLAKPAAAVTETIVKSNAAGMPAWFPSLVKRVIDEGTDVTKQFGTVEREIVHATELPSGTKVLVTQDLGTGDTMVDIGLGKHGWSAGRHGQPTRLALRKGEWIEPTKTKKGIKTKDEFMVEEAEFTGGHPENVKFEETVDFKYGDHGSDFSEIEQYATKSPVSSGSSHGEVQRSLRREGWHGKKEKARQLAMDKKYGGLKSTYKKDPHVRGKQADLDDWAEGRAESRAEEFDEFASGGLAHLLGE